MYSEVRYIVRVLFSRSLFSGLVIISLSLGIGSAAAIFNFSDWILFRSDAYPPDTYVIAGRTKQITFNPVRLHLMAEAYEQQSHGVAAYGKAALMAGNVALDGRPVATGWLGVTPNLFSMLSVEARLGRVFQANDARPGSDNVAVISFHFWRQHYGGSTNVLGSKLTVGSDVCTVIGVLANGSSLPGYFAADIYRPLVYTADPAQPWAPGLFLLAHLQKGVSREQAEAELGSVTIDYPQSVRPFYIEDKATLVNLAELDTPLKKQLYWVLIGAVICLYCIACLNASNLLLASILGQLKEFTVRIALGGGRSEIFRLIFLQSFLLVGISAIVGVLVSYWVFPLLLSIAGGRSVSVSLSDWIMNWHISAFLGVISLITAFLIALLPATQISRLDVFQGIRQGSNVKGESTYLRRVRGALVIFQIAFSLVLLIGAGLMMQTFRRLVAVDLGVSMNNRAKVVITFPSDYPTQPDSRLIKLREIIGKLEALPGVQKVGFGSEFILSGAYRASQNFETPDGVKISAAMAMISSSLPDVAGIKLKSGRWLNPSVRNEVLVNESFAHARWPNENPVGKELVPKLVGGPANMNAMGWTVVGVVADLRNSPREPVGLYIYASERMNPAAMNSFIIQYASVHPEELLGRVRQALFDYDSRLVVPVAQPLTALYEKKIWAEALAESTFKTISAIALFLTIIGLISVLAYSVSIRLTEFGVRLALGASRKAIFFSILKPALWWLLFGSVIGTFTAVASAHTLKSLLYQTPSADPFVICGAILMMGLACLLGCILPAVLALRIDIKRLLQAE